MRTRSEKHCHIQCSFFSVVIGYLMFSLKRFIKSDQSGSPNVEALLSGNWKQCIDAEQEYFTVQNKTLELAIRECTFITQLV